MEHAFGGNFYGNGQAIRNLVLPGGDIDFIGFFGYIHEALVQDLRIELGVNDLSVSGSSIAIGIITGGHKNSVIRNCGVYSPTGMSVSANNAYIINVFGVSGRDDDVQSQSIIENCYVSMNITVNNTGTHIGVSGISCMNGTIRNCYYIGNITATGSNAYMAGIGRALDITIENCYITGTLTNNGANSQYTYAGGIGAHESTITNSVSLAKEINCPNDPDYARIQHDAPLKLTNNYAYSGMLLNGSAITSADPNGRDGLDKTAEELTQRDAYENGLGWDFNQVWEMGPASYPFPIFKWQQGVIPLPPDFSPITAQ